MSQICNQIIGNVSSYPSFISNPAVAMVRYLLQKMLGKFLKNGISLSPADLSMADISVNDLEFDCQVRSLESLSVWLLIVFCSGPGAQQNGRG